VFNSTVGRLFGGIFAATPTDARAQPQQPVSPPAKAQPTAVGLGDANERHVTIGGTPVLFRDEGDVVVQFTPAFDYALQETTCGMKLIPSLTPHWEMCAEHRCSMTQAVVNAIQAGGQQPRRLEAAKESAPLISEKPAAVFRGAPVSQSAATERPTHFNEQREPHRHDGATFGRIVEWGEKTFPDRKRPGKTYESFALTVQTRTGRRDLQGEGLKDAIAEVGATPGNQVEVRRLGKIKVPAVDDFGQPKLDAAGRQVLWDKWQWSIKKKS
jgi:hypothetical protein